MKKKLILLTLCTIFTWVCAVAQTQHGVVKTPGRLASNGKVIAGKRIAGATVQVKGRTAVRTGADGTFSFPVPGNKFFIQSVKKQGYILIDPEAITRQYTYSSNPITLALVIPTEQADDKLAKERQIRNTLQKKLHAREDEIEGLKAQNKISQEDYRKELQRLYAEQESNEKLIKEMAERYTKIDFDELDEFNLRISDCILNSRLTEADSMLRTKGDINARIDRLNKQHEANVEVRDNLEKSEALEQKDRDEIAQDCYHRYELFAMDHQNDSAALYLELRAALDTTNLEWQESAGDFIKVYLADYPLALKYYHRELLEAQKRELIILCANLYFKISNTYKQQGDFDSYAENLATGITLGMQLDEEVISSATTYNNIAVYYFIIHDFDKALDNYLKALDIKKKTLGNEHPDVADTYNNISMLYIEKCEYDNALEYLFKALEIIEKVLGKEHQNTAIYYDEISTVYSKMGDFDKALEYLLMALKIKENALGNEHPDVAETYNDISLLFFEHGNYDKTLEYGLKSLNIRKQVLGKRHPDIAESYNNIGTVYYRQGDYNKALEFISMALNIYNSVLGTKHPTTAKINDNISMIYYKLGNYDKFFEYSIKALDIQIELLGIDHPTIARNYNNIGIAYYQLGDYNKALEYLYKTLEIQENVYGVESQEAHSTRNNIEFVTKQLNMNNGRERTNEE